jgi:hypothetical protein
VGELEDYFRLWFEHLDVVVVILLDSFLSESEDIVLGGLVRLHCLVLQLEDPFVHPDVPLLQFLPIHVNHISLVCHQQ